MQLRIIFQYRRLTSATSSSSVPYCGTSCWYMADMACESAPNLISRDGVRHDVLPPVNTSECRKAPRGGEELQTVMAITCRRPSLLKT